MFNLKSSAILNSVRWSVWGQQYFASVAAIGALVAMVSLLFSFNNQPIFEWKGISLNTITSILSVTIKAAVAFVISESIAQWKWILFSREERRFLIDFDRIDGATRGPLGSLRILLKTRGAFVAQFGAVLTLVSIALDPFAQQLIQLRQEIRYIEPGNHTAARISLSTNYFLGTAKAENKGFLNLTWHPENETSTSVETEWWNITTNIPPSMEGAIMSAFYKSPEELQRETLFQCTTGNCTFDPFVTLSICHKCNDITSELANKTGNFFNFTNTIEAFTNGYITQKITAIGLPNGHFIANSNDCLPYNASHGCAGKPFASTTFGTGNPNKTVSMRDLDTILWSMSFIYPDFQTLERSGSFWKDDSLAVTWPNIALKASECALYYCINNITSIVENSQLRESITEMAGLTRSPGSWDEEVTPNKLKGPEYYAPADEIHSLEFHKYWSVADYGVLKLGAPSQESDMNRVYAYIDPASIKSLSAHFQQLFRWEDWYNNTEIRQSFQNIPGMEDAVGFNGAIYGPLPSADTEMNVKPATLKHLVSWSRSNHSAITAVFETMAVSMSNEMRRNSAPGDQARNGMDTMAYTGLVGSPIVLYEVVWPWIILHVTILACAWIFLAMTVYLSGVDENIPLWKSSSLAAIRHGHDIGGLLSDAGPTVKNMEEAARKLYASEGRHGMEEAKPCIVQTELVANPKSQSQTV